MLESRMGCAGINHVGHSQLPDPPQALEYRMVDDFMLPITEIDEAMDWVANFEGLAHLKGRIALPCAFYAFLHAGGKCRGKKRERPDSLTADSKA